MADRQKVKKTNKFSFSVIYAKIKEINPYVQPY